MKWKKRFFVLMTIGLVMFFSTVSIAVASSEAKKGPPQIDPANFVSEVTNPYFPLVPGTTFVYEGQSEGVLTREVMTVTNETKVILGVTTTVVHVQSFEFDGEMFVLVEDTFDWYAQDVEDNVWYFGEDTRELDENGNVISTEGSWEAGVDGAQPGIIMLADPKKGKPYQQENAPDVAEDRAKVIGFEDNVCVLYGCFDNVLVTKEWTPLERGVVENKYYAKGVGFILSIMVKGGEERLELVSISQQ
jgi:hypothetical protein